jgi:hypothetical protein
MTRSLVLRTCQFVIFGCMLFVDVVQVQLIRTGVVVPNKEAVTVLASSPAPGAVPGPALSSAPTLPGMNSHLIKYFARNSQKLADFVKV